MFVCLWAYKALVLIVFFTFTFFQVVMAVYQMHQAASLDLVSLNVLKHLQFNPFSSRSGCQILRPAQECPLYSRRQKETECCEVWTLNKRTSRNIGLLWCCGFGGIHLVVTAKLCDFGKPSSQCYNLWSQPEAWPNWTGLNKLGIQLIVYAYAVCMGIHLYAFFENCTYNVTTMHQRFCSSIIQSDLVLWSLHHILLIQSLWDAAPEKKSFKEVLANLLTFKQVDSPDHS